MPFAVAWTDRAHLPEFADDVVAHHERQLAAWDVDDWCLLLVAFHEGRPVGSQSLCGKAFAGERTVKTGSWLGQPWQNRGLGGEMRTGVLELAFRGLGAETAVSGAFLDNPQSARVSERLGYREAGEAVHAPRGTEVRERVFRLDRGDWRPPVPVELEGVEPALFISRSGNRC